MTRAQMDTKQPIKHPYKCEVDITFPTAIDAKRAFEVLSVDDEIGNRVIKQFFICKTDSENKITLPCPIGAGNVLRVLIQATEAKMLRVALSAFYDAVAIVLKCFQEFGDHSTSKH